MVRDEDLKRRVAEACSHQTFLSEAPVVIVACGRGVGYNMGGYIGSLSMVMDATIATIHLILAAGGGGPRNILDRRLQRPRTKEGSRHPA